MTASQLDGEGDLPRREPTLPCGDSLPDVLRAFFREMNSARIRYAVVGDTRSFPDEVQGDVDVVVPHHSLLDLRGLISQFASRRGIDVVQILQHESSAYYTCLAWIGPEGYTVLKIDYCSDYVRRARLLLTARELVEKRQQRKFGSGPEDHFFVPSTAVAFLYYLCKRLDKGEITPRNLEYLRHLWESDLACRERCAEWWGAGQLVALQALLHGEDSGQSAGTLRRQLYRRRRRRLQDILSEARRRVVRLFRPTGLTVAVMGPDGAGKSLLIEAITHDQAGVFRRVKHIHLRPRVFSRAQDQAGPTTDPHGKRPYGRLLSTLKLLYVATEYCLGNIIRVQPNLVKSTLVLFDRYYHDLLVDPQRSRYGGPAWLVRFVGLLVPKPALMLVLDADVLTILARKQEVSAEECARQVAAYRDLATQYEFVRLVDATRPASKVAADASSCIAAHMAARTRHRHG